MSVTVPELVTRKGRKADRADAVLAAVLCAAGVAEALLGGSGGNRVVYVAAAVLATLPLAWRRRAPGRSAVLACLPLMVGPLLATRTDDLFVLILALVIAVFSLALHGDTRTFVTCHAVIVAGLVSSAFVAGEGFDDCLYIIVFTSIIAVPARLLRRRLLDVGRLTERALRAETAAEAEALAAVTDERNRLARELHDIIGHGVSLMVVQAAAAESNLDDLSVARHSLNAVQTTGREAIADLSRLLALLRDEHGFEGPTPQPGIADLSRLALPVSSTGVPSAVSVSGDPSRVPAALGLTVYRVVQEGLTNAARHAAGAPASASVSVRDHRIDIEVVNGPPLVRDSQGLLSVGTGTGLAGLGERVALFDGTIDCGIRPDGGFALRVGLPLVDPLQ